MATSERCNVRRRAYARSRPGALLRAARRTALPPVSRQRGAVDGAWAVLVRHRRSGCRRAQQGDAHRASRSPGRRARRQRRRARARRGAARAPCRRAGAGPAAVSRRCGRVPRLRLGPLPRAPSGASARRSRAARRRPRHLRLGVGVGPSNVASLVDLDRSSRSGPVRPDAAGGGARRRGARAAARQARRPSALAPGDADLPQRGGSAPTRPGRRAAGGIRASRFAPRSRTPGIWPRSLACASTSSRATSSRPTCRSDSRRRWTSRRGRIYRRLRARNAAPFAAYLDFPDGAVLSASPERFLHVDDRGPRRDAAHQGDASARHRDPSTTPRSARRSPRAPRIAPRT